MTTAEIDPGIPGRPVPPPVTTALAAWRTAIDTLPETLLVHPAPSVRDVRENVASAASTTTRVAGLDGIVWTNPSDHLRVQGGTPARLTFRFVGWPEQAVRCGPESAALGAGEIDQTRVSVEKHPLVAVVVTASVTLPAAPAVNVICRVPAPAVIVPFVTFHAYVAPRRRPPSTRRCRSSPGTPVRRSA